MIIGGGPAGLSAFLWCHDLGMTSILIESQKELGGQLLSIYNPITNYPGRTAANGRELLVHFNQQIKGLNNGTIVNDSVVKFDTHNTLATLSSGDVIEARSAIVATGVRRRQLGIKGEEQFVGRGILESGARDKNSVTGKHVAIIGGGDAALENALMLSEVAEKVYVIHRRPDLSARTEFVNSVVGNPRIELVLNATVNDLIGGESLSAIEVSTDSSRRKIAVDAALIRIGVQPNSDLFRKEIDCDERGYVKTNKAGQTNIENVFAIGDLANPVAPTISTAAGTGSSAVKALYRLLYSQSGL
jgi:thioredoxin reductase (NADPH)